MSQQTEFPASLETGLGYRPGSASAPLRFAPVLSSGSFGSGNGPAIGTLEKPNDVEPRYQARLESETWETTSPNHPGVIGSKSPEYVSSVTAIAAVAAAPIPAPIPVGRRDPALPLHARPSAPIPVPVPVAAPVPVPATPVSPAVLPDRPVASSAESRKKSSRSGSHRRHRSKKHTVAGRRVHWLALSYLMLVMIVSLGIELISEGWWLTAAIVYVPRVFWLLPALVTIPACLRWNPRMTPVGILAALFAVGPIMGYRTAGYFAATAPRPGALRVVSCNVRGFEPDFPAQIAEIGVINPDLVVFQEAFNDHPLRGRHFAEWNNLRKDEYLISSRHPLVLLGECESPAFNRIAAIAARVEDPAGHYVVVNIHLTTARFGLMKLKPATVIGRNGIQQLTNYISDREEEALAVRRWAEEMRGNLPLICLGDFNMPVDSSIQGACFGDLLNTFEQVGTGYGYTAPNQTSTWPAHNPWLRIDHILVSHGDWEVHRAWTGSANGSDHKLVAAIFSRHDGSKY